MKRLALLAAPLAASLAACGPDEVDLTGLYSVSADLASMPCGTDEAVMTPPLAIKFAKSNFFGTDFFTYAECMDLAGTMCTGGGTLDEAFSEPIDGGWRGIVTSSSSGGPSSPTCTLLYKEQTATMHGTLLIIEATSYSAQVDNTAALCTTDEADKRNTSMPCTAHARIEATKQ